MFQAAFKSAVVAVALLATSAPAFAQQDGGDKVVYTHKTAVIEFGEVTLDGTRQGPDQAFVVVKGRPKFANMIKLRGTFRPEMAKSADSL